MRHAEAEAYLETTVFNWYFEPERGFAGDIQLLFDEIAAEKFEAYVSDYVIEELLKTKDLPRQKQLMDLLERSHAVILRKSEEAEALAEQYALHKVISETHYYDRWHLACATVHGLDAIISFNFTHINRLWTKDKILAVNQLNDYKPISIGLPMEVTGNENL